MKFTDIKNMSPDELRSKLKELRLALGKLEFQRNSNVLKKGHELVAIKKDIARILTALHI